MRRNIFLEGKQMANAGLLISYCVLIATLAAAGTFLLAHWHFSPVKVMRESPAAIAAMQPRVVDEVIVGENEEDHDMDGQMISLSANNGKTARSAQSRRVVQLHDENPAARGDDVELPLLGR